MDDDRIPRWEYKAVKLNPLAFGMHVNDAGQVEIGKDEFFGKYLTNFGDDGWELVAAPNEQTFYFKRRKLP